MRSRKLKEDRQHNDQNKKDKQRSTKHTHKTKDRSSNVNPTKPGAELMCSGRVGSTCYTSDTHRATLFINPVIGDKL